MSRDPHVEAALRTRLDVFSRLGLASRAGRAEWKIAPELRTELEQMVQLRAERKGRAPSDRCSP
jgi:hypothetical protein